MNLLRGFGISPPRNLPGSGSGHPEDLWRTAQERTRTMHIIDDRDEIGKDILDRLNKDRSTWER